MSHGVCNICDTPYSEIFVHTICDGGQRRKICTCDHCGKELMKQQLGLVEGTIDAPTGSNLSSSEEHIYQRDRIPA